VANTNLKLTGLDFNELKTNFKEFLKRSDSPFKDMDYEGSNISQLLDIFSYNTYLNAFYLNMIASEMFLDTATLKDSVISHVKELNYVPRSYRSSEAKVSFSLTPSSPLDTLLIPKGTSFTTKIGSNNFSFTTADNLVVTANSSGAFNVADLTIYEGNYVVDSFVYSASNTSQRFVISNPNIDTRSLSVYVIENEGANSYSYTRATSLLDSTSTSQIFFLQAAENSQYEILFGDGVVGRLPQNGATIVAEYRVSNGELPNGSATFTIDGAIQGQSNISTISTTQIARGGSVSESLDSIKFNAPRAYQNQERAVTATDYENILKANFSEIESISVYGGEDAYPPQYGRVFISIDTNTGDGVSDIDKRRYEDFIKQRAPIGLSPVFINPEFLYLEIDVTARYNSNVTKLTSDAIATLVRTTISDYNSEKLNGFKKTIRCSKLAENINNSHSSIVGIDMLVVPFVKMVPIPGVGFNKTVTLGFELNRYYNLSTGVGEYIRSPVRAVYSSKFVYNGISCTLQDDGNGKVGIYSTDQNDNRTLVKYIGTVDYTTGTVQIEGLNVTSYDNSYISLHFNSKTKDISSTKNTILIIKDADVEVEAVPIKE